MNYNIIKKSYLEINPNKGIGINIPFNGSTGINLTYYTKDSIRANLLNFLLTGNRERILNPKFGTDIRNQIFEQINEQNFKNIENIIYDYIINNFPDILLEELNITSSENNSINIYFKYSIKNTNISDNIQLNINND